MTPAEVHALAVLHGLTFEQAITATAIAWAESGLRPDAVGDVDLEDEVWGPSMGLYQIRSLRVDTGTGKERDVERLGDPSFNTRSMVAVSKGGTNWQPWSVYKNGRFLAHIDAVRAAVTEAPMTRIYTRDEWGAEEPSGRSPAPGQTRGIAVHYLGEGRGPTGGLDDSMSKMRDVQAFHMGPARGWADFAYNWAVDMYGHAFEGRGTRVRNAANGGGVRNGYDANAGWSSVLYLNGTGGPDLTDEAKRAINDVAAHAGVAGGEWLGHRDFLSTDCPGEETYAWVQDGHPSGDPAPVPEPQPLPDMEVSDLFIYDYVPDGTSTPVAIIYTDGKLKWGLESGEQLAFFATGKVPHLGAKGDQFHNELDWHPGGKKSNPGAALAASIQSQDVVEVEAGYYSLAGGIDEAMERSPFETGDPGCAGPG